MQRLALGRLVAQCLFDAGMAIESMAKLAYRVGHALDDAGGRVQDSTIKIKKHGFQGVFSYCDGRRK